MSDRTVNRLLICSRSHEPHGGVERIIADLCCELPARGWNVKLALTQGDRFNDTEAYRRIHQDLPIVVVDGRLGTRHSRLSALTKVIRRERPDVILSMRVFDVYEAVGRLKTANGPRLAVGIRAYESSYLSDLKRYVDTTDLCVTSGELLAAACREICGIPVDRAVSIAGGVHAPHAAAVPRTPVMPIRLLYAGRLEREQKRALDIIPFLTELDRLRIQYELDIAGAGPCEDELHRMLQGRISTGHVRFHGWVSRERLYQKLYPEADCFVHFAAWEGITISPREAMVHGVVPIVSRFVGQKAEKQLIDGETALTFPVGDATAAAACLQRLLYESTLMEKLSRNGMHSQSGAYGFGGSMDAWAMAFDRCLERPVREGRLPRIPDRLRGRLDRLCVPSSWQSWLRQQFRRPVLQQSPGSEWPTNSGLMTREEDTALTAFAARDNIDGAPTPEQ